MKCVSMNADKSRNMDTLLDPAAKKNNIIWGLGVFVTLVLTGMLAYFAWTTVHSSDDYWYSTFWDNGLRGYVKLLDEHYRTFNGRTLVHMLVHAVLHFGRWAFAAVCCVLCLGAILVACRAARMDRKYVPSACGLFLAGLLVMPNALFTEGMMWISAYGNYFFPVALLCVLILVNEQHRHWSVCVGMAFLCGATTEQMGLVCGAVTIVYLLDAGFRRERWGVRSISVCAAVVGVLTIFLSPATRMRASANVSHEGLWRTILGWLDVVHQEAELLTRSVTPILMMLILLVLSVVFLYKRTNNRIWIVATMLGAGGLAVWWFADAWLQTAAAILVFLVLAALSVGLIVNDARVSGVLALAALASCAVILPVNSLGPRLMVPFYVLVILSASVLVGIQADRILRLDALISLAMVLTVCTIIPAVQGYWHNYKIDRFNEAFLEKARESNLFMYRIDFDFDYTYIGKIHTNSSYQKFYLQSVGMPEDTQMVYFSADYEVRKIQYCEAPYDSVALQDGNGVLYFQLRKFAEETGGILEWNAGSMVLSLKDHTYQLSANENEIHVSYADAMGENEIRTYSYRFVGGVSYCSESFLEDILGIDVMYDAELKRCILSVRQ